MTVGVKIGIGMTDVRPHALVQKDAPDPCAGSDFAGENRDERNRPAVRKRFKNGRRENRYSRVEIGKILSSSENPAQVGDKARRGIPLNPALASFRAEGQGGEGL